MLSHNSKRHLFFTSLAVCPLVRVAVCRTEKLLSGVVDKPLYILKTSSNSVVRHGTIHSSRVLLNAHFEFDVDMSANSI